MVLQERCIFHKSPQKSRLNDQPQQSHLLPRNCRVYLNSTGVQYNPRFWKLPHTFEPNRWLSEAPNLWDPSLDPSSNPRLLEDSGRIPMHHKGTFLTFSEGARACLGRKFAAVEFVAFFASVLRRNRLVLDASEDRDRVEKVLRLRCAGAITLAPAEDVKLLLQPRTAER